MYKLQNKNILLGVGGGIAVYKSAELVRELGRLGADCQVAMTQAATEFVTPLTFQALSKRRVATSLLDAGEDAEIGHIQLADWADAFLIAPATANLIARMAHGMADDVVTATALVTRAPIVVAPAMNTHMYEHPAVRANLETLESYGCRVVEPDHGELACGHVGAGRLPDAQVLLEELSASLLDQDLAGVRVLVSSGPTQEVIDPVRHISNRSSGKMGHALAKAARRRGADVKLVSGPTGLAKPYGCDVIDVSSAAEMGAAIHKHASSADVVVMVAAVADYRPKQAHDIKMKKRSEKLALELEPTEDILGSLEPVGHDRVVVGFAAETNDVRRHAERKLKSKGLDLIVANDVSAKGVGFDGDTNRALLMSSDGHESDSGIVSKDELADLILDRVGTIRAGRSSVAARG